MNQERVFQVLLGPHVSEKAALAAAPACADFVCGTGTAGAAGVAGAGGSGEVPSQAVASSTHTITQSPRRDRRDLRDRRARLAVRPRPAVCVGCVCIGET